jgi:hypothetical protein
MNRPDRNVKEGFAVKKTVFGVALLVGLLTQGLARAEQAPTPSPVPTTPAPTVTAPAPTVVANAPAAPGCGGCGTACHGAWGDHFWAWLCYRPLHRAGCCCSSPCCCHPPLYMYFADHCRCGHGAPDRMPTKECGDCCHGAFLARLRGFVQGTGCAVRGFFHDTRCTSCR